MLNRLAMTLGIWK